MLHSKRWVHGWSTMIATRIGHSVRYIEEGLSNASTVVIPVVVTVDMAVCG